PRPARPPVHLGSARQPRQFAGRAGSLRAVWEIGGAAEPIGGGPMILAQLTDPHIVAPGALFRCPIQGTAPDAERVSRELDTALHLARAVAALNALVPKPDAVVITGDLVDHGEPAEYEHLRHLLAPLR